MKKNKWKIKDGRARAAILALELARVNGRLSPNDRREKYTRMVESPFAFYRGTAHLYYRDLFSQESVENSPFSSEDAVTWIQGDLHLNNFGAFCDGDGVVVFDLNDFDEGCVTSYLYDVWRGAASLALTGQDNGFDEEEVVESVDVFAQRYWEEIKRYLVTDRRHYDKVTAESSSGPLRKFLKKCEARESRSEMLDDWTRLKGDGRSFDMDQAKLAPVMSDDYRLLTSAIAVYKDHLISDLKGNEDYFKVLDCARRLGAGVGSFGTPRYYVLIRGENDNPEEDRILDVKQQGLPSCFPFLCPREQNLVNRTYGETLAGKRVIEAQRAMLAKPDRHLGHFTILGRSFSVRERSPYKKSLKVEKLKKFKSFKEMAFHWGTILATGHSRGDNAVQEGGPDSFEREFIRLTRGCEQDFRAEVVDFALRYARQVRIDHELFQGLISGPAR